MIRVFLLSERQMARISPCFPLSHGVPRVDDRRVVSGIVYVIRNGLQWKDAPRGYGPHKTLYKPRHPLKPARRLRPDFRGPGQRRAKARALYDRCHSVDGAQDCGEPLEKGAVPRRIGRTKGGLNSKLHAVCGGVEQAPRPAAQRGPDERSQRRTADP